MGCTSAAAGPATPNDAGSAAVDSGEVGDAAVNIDADLPPALLPATLHALQALSPTVLPDPPPDVSNRFADNTAAATLGQQLFFDPGFSGALLDSDNDGSATALGVLGQSGKVSCAGCHIPDSGFLDTRSTRQTVSLASAWGKRRAPSLLDVGQAKLLMWDGRHDALYNQPFGALENGVEMNSSRLYAAEQIYARYRAPYEAIFGPIPVPLDDVSRFPQLTGATTGCRTLSVTTTGIFSGTGCHGVPGDGAEFDSLSPSDQNAATQVWVNAGKAIAAYERRLACGPSRFDQWMHGTASALTPSEQRGAALFAGQREDGSTIKGCDGCHSGPFLTDESFHNVGMQTRGVGPLATFFDIDDNGAQGGIAAALTDPLNVAGSFSDGNDGRLPASPPANAVGAFRTPSLRCVGMRPSFLHNGQFRVLSDVVLFFDGGGNSTGYLGTSEIVPLGLTAQEREDLLAFLLALTGPGPAQELLTKPALP
jgi:cytochrome c peroxidase